MDKFRFYIFLEALFLYIYNLFYLVIIIIYIFYIFYVKCVQCKLNLLHTFY